MTKSSSLDVLIEKLNSFSADNYWDLGKFVVERVLPTALKEGVFGDQVLKMMASVPGGKFSYGMLRQCQQFYTYYPDVGKRPLPEIFYFELATKVADSRKRKDYEKLAAEKKWTISEFRKKIHDDDLARRQDEKTKYGFDLKEKNVWSFDVPDPRFGKSNYKGRIPGQIVANALYYYTKPGDYVVDPFAGSGTLGDVIGGLSSLQDRKYKLYDVNPTDERIVRNNVLQTGIPEQTGTVDYVFLDPPSDFFPGVEDNAMSASAAKAESLLKVKGVVRETARILKAGGRVSIVLEPALGADFIDFPFELSLLMKDFGFKSVGKVYLPKKVDASRQRDVLGTKSLVSDCREMLTFEKQ